MITELCVPGFKALIKLATENKVDLQTVELREDEKVFKEDIAKLNMTLKEGAQVHELMTMMKEDIFPALKVPKQQASILEVVNRFEKATVNQVLVQEVHDRSQRNIGLKTVIKSIQEGHETMENLIMDISREFGPSSEPVKEMAAVGYMLREGVTTDEVMTFADSGLLPALKRPQVQAPIVTMTADKGHIVTVCEILTDETVKEIKPFDKKDKEAAARIVEVKEILKKAKTESINIKSKFLTVVLKVFLQLNMHYYEMK